MSGPRATRTTTVTVRLTPEQLRAAQLVAGATCRTVSSLMQFTLIEFIRTNYPQAMIPGATLNFDIKAPT